MYKGFLDYGEQLMVEAKEEKAAETAREMQNDGFSIEKIAKYVKMPISWVEEVLREGVTV